MRDIYKAKSAGAMNMMQKNSASDKLSILLLLMIFLVNL